MTLGGLVKHLAYVEYLWFSRWLDEQGTQPPWAAVDWVAEPDWEWVSAGQDSPDELLALWTEWVENSRRLPPGRLRRTASAN